MDGLWTKYFVIQAACSDSISDSKIKWDWFRSTLRGFWLSLACCVSCLLCLLPVLIFCLSLGLLPIALWPPLQMLPVVILPFVLSSLLSTLAYGPSLSVVVSSLLPIVCGCLLPVVLSIACGGLTGVLPVLEDSCLSWSLASGCLTFGGCMCKIMGVACPSKVKTWVKQWKSQKFILK